MKVEIVNKGEKISTFGELMPGETFMYVNDLGIVVDYSVFMKCEIMGKKGPNVVCLSKGNTHIIDSYTLVTRVKAEVIVDMEGR